VDAAARAAALREHESATEGCTACALAETRTRVVVGCGNADAELLIVAEAPGFAEDRGAGPFAGEAGALLERLLAGIGLTPADVYLTTLLKCRPPQTRDPSPEEIASCEPHLFRQIDLVQPAVVATLGTIATRVLSGRPDAITQVHGRPQGLTCGSRAVTLLPLYHPAVALYTPAMLRTLENDVALLPGLLGRDAVPVSPVVPTPSAEQLQLGLF
jgi:DNA polymerase